ncbi:hypothetical protein N0V93_008711 [Gnomoniopsis smithogilvyi]|uniref:UDENN FLCN/SMCR8-type domain-containing protein n=1 Tax=Gnomoniopsis smithogilvyi TaxID=1191159 RepID=A0A9W8YN94_9PEZI|nr:hypothetical protein N0V93_008711 [Gnomoniopsis smithogilvyi]
MILTSGVQLCLAHYCDVHGPTPLMVTEGLPIPCSACYEDSAYASDRAHSTSSTPTSTIQSGASISEALRKLNLENNRSVTSSTAANQDQPSSKAALRRATQNGSTSAFDTPPLSPRYPPDPSPAGNGRRESSYRRTYDETTTKRAGPCENCAMTLPKRQGAGASDNESENESGPTLRTRAPYARAYGSGVPGNASPPNSTSTASDDDDGEAPRKPCHRRTGTITSTTSRSSASSASAPVHGHTHYQYYTSTHEPVVPSSFSIVRASCIRTLSFETLPRGTATASNTPLISPSTPGFVTTHSSGAVTSGGPIFFGDPSAGYTTAYIFRIPDVHARGHKRVYAFLALSTHRERLAMKTFTFISNAFRDLAAWIQGLAEAEAERASEGNSPLSAGGMYGAGAGPMGMAPRSQDQSPSVDTTTGSGFLSSGMGGLSRRMGAGYGYGGSGASTKARGLPELVGLPDFFLELHQKFVQLLLELGVVLRS